jgi:PQQ-dependent catabolism-associated CXXCW motif protein
MVGTLTPSTIPDAKVVTTNDLIEAMKSKSDFLLVDAWDDDDHNEIPGSTHINYAGNPGNFDDEIQSKLLHAMNDLVGGNPNYPVVFYCAGPNCWESYNAALRAEAMGLNNVYWYRGGLCAWQEAVSESSRTPTTPRRRSYSNDAPYSNYSPPSYTPPVDTYGSCINACNNINAYTNSGMAAEQSCLASCH